MHVILLKIFFPSKNTILFLKKPYNVYKTLILMDSNIIKGWPYNTKLTKVITIAQK